MSSENLLVRNVDKYGSSPGMLQRDALLAIKEMLNNEYGIISAANPVSLLLETSSMQTAAAVGKYWLLNRRQYPVSAQTYEDLWYHFSEQDWIGAFSLPSTAEFIISFHYDELLQMVQPVNDGSETKLLRIPRGMRITVGGVDFLLDYPVNIVQLKHGGFRVTYDTTEKSPIQDLSSNVVDHQILTFGATGDDAIKRFSFTLQLVQVTETVVEDAINAAGRIEMVKKFPDDYFFSRVYTGNDQTGWTELTTTHCPDVYDTTKPTAFLKVIENNDDNTLTVSIPKIYNNIQVGPGGIITSPLGSRLKTEIYSTLGYLTMNLDEYVPSQFSHDFFPSGERKRDYSGLGNYSSALKSVKAVSIYSRDFISQGRNKLSFEELRQRVIDNTTGPNVVPVSHQSIRDKIQDNQFKIIKSVDYVTNRVYWAIRDVPDPTNASLITPAAASIETLTTTISDLISTGTVIDNGKRVTITPDSIYQLNNGKLSIMNKTEIDRIVALSPENKAKTVSAKEMFFSPFHYVVDTENATIKIRPYYLDKPETLYKTYLDSNTKLDLSLTISQYAIEKKDTGYVLHVTMKSNDEYKRFDNNSLWAQLLVHPYHDRGYTYIVGELTGRTDDNEPIFSFPLNTRFDIDETNSLILTNGTLNNVRDVHIPIDLETDVELIFGFYGDYANWQRAQLDNKINLNLLDNDPKAILNEGIRIKLGSYLEYLWVRARTHASDVTYRRHDADVPLTYTEDVYGADAATGSILNIVNGKPQYTIKHRKGENVLDSKGNIVYRYKKGDIYLDENGNTVISKPREIIRRLELTMVDATYWFATDDIAKDYRKELVATFIDWLTDDLRPLNRNTLEQTKILFYPSSTMGEIRVIYNEGIDTYINAAQSLSLDLTVDKQIYLDYDIQEKIKESSIRVIKEELKKDTISVSSILSQLVKEYGSDVIGVQLRNLGNTDKIISFTVVEEGKKPTIRKKLTVNSDETLSVREDITFNFVLHSPDSLNE